MTTTSTTTTNQHEPMDIDDGGADEGGTTHQFQSFFTEANQVMQLIEEYAVLTEVHQLKKQTQQLQKIFEKYLEKGQLLDPHLEAIISRVMHLVEQVFAFQPVTTIQAHVQMKSTESLRRSLFTVLYLLTKVRGYKAIVKQFPHELSQLEPLYEIYMKIPSSEWETRYILMLWLSLIVMNPFPFSAVDAQPDSDNSLTRRMMDVAIQALSDPGKTRDGASVFLSKLLTRHDLHHQLTMFLNWANESLSRSSDQLLQSGIFATLIDIFKSGRRDEMIQVVDSVVSFAVADTSNVNNTLIRQLTVKLAQRIGLIYLKPRVVSWRYQKGRKSLLQNLKPATAGDNDGDNNQTVGATNTSRIMNTIEQEGDDDDDIDVPEQIEEVIGKMLDGLRDRDTIVRWSAAKGIGRITMRLPKDFGDEVVGSVLDLLSPTEGDTAWHGGCLALAELARRGLLLPERLDTVVPVLQKALEYDERKGAHSVGSHVRDSACYVCWAFSRAYAPEVMSPYVSSLARGLLKTAVFDREVNCRRAAAAAFQENVGRQGNFPHGIDILTRADYFTLCNRSNAFLDVSYFIAQFPEYCQSLIDHLVEIKSIHWDKSVRELSAQALHRLCDLDMAYMANTVLPILLPRCYADDINTRHGSIIATAEVMYGLAKNGYQFSGNLKTHLADVIPTIEVKRLYRGKGGEIVREAVCHFIERMSLSKFELPVAGASHDDVVASSTSTKQQLNIFQDTLNTNLKHPNEEIITIAVRAFKEFTSHYYTGSNIALGRTMVSNYVTILKTDANPETRRGYSLALGSVPHQLIDQDTFRSITTILIQKVSIESNPELHDAESRRNAVLGLINICETAGVGPVGVNSSNLGAIFSAFLIGTNDYAVDKRGDIGSLVREASLQALHRWSKLLCSSATELFSPDMAATLTSHIIKQAVEKIDRVRDQAGHILNDLLMSQTPTIVNIPHKEPLIQLITEEQSGGQSHLIDWSSPERTFPLFVRCLHFDEYRSDLLSGLVTSVGGLSSHVYKHSADALVKFVKQLNKSGQRELTAKIADNLLRILRGHESDDRIVIPLLKTLGHLFSHDCLDFISPDKYPFTEQLVVCITTEMRLTKNVSKIFICIDVLCEMLRFEDPTRTKTIQRLFTSGLMSRYPKVREHAGQQIYGTLQIADFVDDEVLDDIFDILSSTNWTAKLDEVKPQVTQLYKLLGIPEIVMVKKVALNN